MGVLVFVVGPRLQVLGVQLGRAGDSSVVVALEPLVAAVAAACFLGERVPARVVVHAAGVSVFWEDGFHFELPDPLVRGAAAGAGSGVVEAPMPGLVKAVFARAGEVVTAGQRLAILEAMKMEHTLTAARDGTVAEVLVAAGDQVEAGAALVRLEEEGGE